MLDMKYQVIFEGRPLMLALFCLWEYIDHGRSYFVYLFDEKRQVMIDIQLNMLD